MTEPIAKRTRRGTLDREVDIQIGLVLDGVIVDPTHSELDSGPILDKLHKLLQTDTNVIHKKPCSTVFLPLAIRSGRGELVALMCKRGLRVDLKLPEMATAFKLSIETNNAPIIHTMVEYGADLNHVFEDGDTPLHLASRCGCPELVCYFLDKGAAWGRFNRQRQTPVYLAVENGHTRVLKELVDRAPTAFLRKHALQCAFSDAVNMTRVHLTDPMIACLDLGADVNGPVYTYTSALSKAVCYCNVPLARYLLERGADPNIGNGDESILMSACYHPSEDMIGLLLAYKADVNYANNFGVTALLRLIKQNAFKSIACVDLLLKAGADVTAIDHLGDAALTVAVRKSRCDVVLCILSRKSDILSDSAKTEALAAAAWIGCKKCMKYLLKYGADIHAADATGCTALEQAIAGYENGFQEVQFLVRKGANVHVVSRTGKTTLMMAINAHQVDIKTIRFLLKKGVDVNARTPCGWTALAHAVIRGFVDITEYLLDNGADMNATDSCGMTPFAHAVIAAKMPMVELFWRRGMDVNWVGSDGKSLVAMAASRYHYYTTLFLLEHGARDYTEDVLLDTAKAHISKQRQILTEYILTRVRTF